MKPVYIRAGMGCAQLAATVFDAAGIIHASYLTHF
jgi:hypothetical protein